LKWVGRNRRKVTEGAATNDYRLVRPDQSVRWVNARSFAIEKPSGKVPWLVEIIEDVTQRREAQHHLLHLARHDALTGLPNRMLFYELLTEALARTENEQLIVSVMLLDIDHFKTFNDTLGHPTGDAVLREFAVRLVGCLRPEDAVGRLGGDEFAVIVTTPTETFGAPFVANRIQNALKAPLALEDRELVVTTSIGIASSPADASDVDALMRCADNALYEAKAAGRNTFRSCTVEMNARAEKKSDIEAALRMAHERNEFVLHYQPKVQAEGGESMSVEALIRWERPGHGLVMPNAFIPALEEIGLIAKVGVWVIVAACRQIRQWEAAGLGRIRVAVNISSRQLREVQFVEQVADAMRTHHVDASLLEFEITESTFMVHGEPTDSALRGLKELGVSISIDDFGTGYSNLAYLQRFEVDALKIDIALIRDVTRNADAATIAIAIINLAHSLRLKVIAEGVETAEQLEFLRLNGCDEVQGYFLSMPMAAGELSARLRTANASDAEARMARKDHRRSRAHG
jgi:diguanylate cyclase (GGDEF)-like protein